MIREKYLQECANSYLAKTYESLDSCDIEFINCIIDAFEAGAKWADANPKSPWISVEDDLPCNHDSLLIKCLPYNSELTKSVLTLVDDGSYQVCDMFINEEGKWEWSYNGTVLYWMPIPKLEEEQS